ncbi:hypothetical protein JAO76_13360 [Pontibacter sp. BT310]|jgi:hypothetical protein|uniref:Phosphoribosylpyrophosphate synthetase n=1 Tax=Pontibacter populi TaxID=890055 RepID=A0ABS6XDI0_9BACT|nr:MULTISPECIES: hypothetical protein [Pontibacter]MBJ6119191.1 hypothetical protein [Pontibacter sp. BT310]MBR0571619.1 hypothetical protein [Microvirga sp. STS03]MBW3366045.1 hypothetical protein [Pontibacter populi]
MQNKEELTTLTKVLTNVRKEGYKTDFTVGDDGLMHTMDSTLKFGPDQLKIVNFYRFEGESNPDDMAILYVLETNTGEKGTISDAYGPYSDSQVEAFMRQVPDMGKNLDSRS